LFGGVQKILGLFQGQSVTIKYGPVLLFMIFKHSGVKVLGLVVFFRAVIVKVAQFDFPSRALVLGYHFLAIFYRSVKITRHQQIQIILRH